MNPEDLKKILEALSAADVREFQLKTGSFDLSLQRGPVHASSPAPSAPAPAPSVAPVHTPSPVAVAAEPSDTQPTEPQPFPTASASAAPAAQAPAEAEPAATGTPIKAPIVGTFYSAPSPDAPPYVKVGDRVTAGQILCIIEAMKLMNEIEAETSGVIKAVLVGNSEPVEYGQTLFLIE